jgi:hypothetical protein
MNSTRWIVAWIAMSWFAGFAGQGVAAQGIVHGVCASTPAAALSAAKSGVSGLGETHGYRVESVRRDPLLRLSWAVIASCDHREWPSVTMPMDAPASAPSAVSIARPDAAMSIVRAGDIVRLWKREPYAHIEMIATSEENGAVGTRVRVRLAMPQDSDGQAMQPQYFAGVVRGPADVEMTP